jgi:hypothetical protein
MRKEAIVCFVRGTALVFQVEEDNQNGGSSQKREYYKL